MSDLISNLTVALVTLGFGWLVGNRLMVHWAIVQKRRELELSALHDFYRLYGEFFAVWKLWSYCRRSAALALEHPEETRWSLLERASASEGSLEAIFVKLASERKLSVYDIETLGRFGAWSGQVNWLTRLEKLSKIGPIWGQ